MQNASSKLLAAFFLVAIAWHAGGKKTSSAQEGGAAATTQWEYQSADASALNIPVYNSLGRGGWELVTIEHLRSDEFVAIFKRPLH